MTTGFDKEKCEQRNRQAALRYGIDSAPIHFLSGPDAGGVTVTYHEGRLPKTAAEALALINAMLPEGAPALSAEQVYIHYVEAANNNFVSDRYMFLGDDTLRNIARGGAAGVAFMNSHRTGGLSTDAEFPFGKTFAGQYQRGTDADGSEVRRAMLGFYMLRGQRPNGDGAPSTDDLDRSIRGGTLFDVSVGLREGEKICDVCDEPVYGAETSCPHLPGTHHSMSEADRQRQRDRGVPDGRASYTYRRGHLGEVSGVFDGAVRGAGFRKAVELANALGGDDLRLAREVYGGLSVKDESDQSENFFRRLSKSIEDGFSRAFGGKQPAPTPPAHDAGPDRGAPTRAAEGDDMAEKTSDAEVEKLRKDSEELAALKKKQREDAAAKFAAEQVKKHKTLPFGADALRAEYLQRAEDDERAPLATGSRVENLTKLFAALPGHRLTEEFASATLPKDATALDNEDDPQAALVKQGVQSVKAYAEKANAAGQQNGARS